MNSNIIEATVRLQSVLQLYLTVHFACVIPVEIYAVKFSHARKSYQLYGSIFWRIASD